MRIRLDTTHLLLIWKFVYKNNKVKLIDFKELAGQALSKFFQKINAQKHIY